MMLRKIAGTGLIGLVMACAACSSNDGPARVTTWKGSSPHFHLSGTYKGESIAAEIQGTTAVSEQKLSCSRQYIAPMKDGQLDLSQARLAEIKLTGVVTLKGESRAFELEFKRNNFQKEAVGSQLEVVPRDDSALPGPGRLWFEWEWHDAVTEDTLDERAAQQGTFMLGELTGNPDAHNIIPDDTGTFGGFITAKWSESEEISLSFTANCAENEIESDE